MSISITLARRIRLLLAGTLSAAISAFLIANDFVEGLVTGLIALLPAVLALALLVAAFKRQETGSPPCPRCGALLDGLALTSSPAILCEGCHRYFEARAHSLAEIEPDRVAGRPVFKSALPENAAFPDCCCICGGSACRKDEILLTSVETQSWQSAFGAAGETHSWKADSVTVPYCGYHSGGAVLGLDPKRGRYIGFKSYPYLRAFCQLNCTEPR